MVVFSKTPILRKSASGRKRNAGARPGGGRGAYTIAGTESTIARLESGPVSDKVKEFIARPRRALITLALPVFVATFVQTMYNIVDTAFVGGLGAESIAALTFCFPLFFFLIGLNSGIAAGMNSLISRRLGAGDKASAEAGAAHGLAMSAAFAAFNFFLGLIALKPVFSLFGADPAVLPLSLGYMRIILLGVFFMFPAFIMSSIFSAQGDTRTPMKVQAAGLALNVALDPVFIYGLKMGVRGAALASVLSFLFTLAIFLRLLKTRSSLRVSFRGFRFSPVLVGEILRVGMPASLMMLILSLYVVFLNRFVAHFGTKAVASFGLVVRLESFASMPIIGLSLSMVTLVGMLSGAKRHDLVRKVVWYGIGLGALFTAAVGLVFMAAPRLWLTIFTRDRGLLDLAAPFLRVDVLTFPLMSSSMIISRALQGLGYGLPGFFINVIRVLLAAVPLAWLFVYVFGWGYLSVAWAMVLGGVAANATAFLWIRVKLARLDARATGISLK
jgi:putative MATE family efflux protein